MNSKYDDRTTSALEADALAEKLMTQQERVSWFWLAILVALEAAIYYFDKPGWIGIVIAIVWLGMFLQNELKLIYHELVEMNDHISGRKDGLRKMILKK